MKCRLRLLVPLLTSLLLAAFPAAGDRLSDLRAVLQRYPAKAPFAVSASIQVNGESEDVVEASRGGSMNFEVEFGAGGMLLRVPPSALGAAESEAEGKKRNPESLTPTRTAMVALTVFDIIDATDIASMLLNEFEGATLIQETETTSGGRAATLLRFKVKPALAGTRSRFVNEPKIELRVWVTSDGMPVVAERDSDYSASILFVKAANVRKERWEIGVWGDRLYASHVDQNNQASAIGKHAGNSLTVAYTPK
ncbi:MAG: hypothetical protein ACXVJT_16685 [Thermoanaerobaculia bacterium]